MLSYVILEDLTICFNKYLFLNFEDSANFDVVLYGPRNHGIIISQ